MPLEGVEHVFFMACIDVGSEKASARRYVKEDEPLNLCGNE